MARCGRWRARPSRMKTGSSWREAPKEHPVATFPIRDPEGVACFMASTCDCASGVEGARTRRVFFGAKLPMLPMSLCLRKKVHKQTTMNTGNVRRPPSTKARGVDKPTFLLPNFKARSECGCWSCKSWSEQTALVRA